MNLRVHWPLAIYIGWTSSLQVLPPEVSESPETSPTVNHEARLGGGACLELLIS